MKKRWIPFKFTPAAWSLSGEAYETAKACYELEGIELGMKLADIKYAHNEYERLKYRNKVEFEHNVISELDYLRTDIEIDYQYNRISEFDCKSKILKLNHNHGLNPTYDYDLALLKREHKVITETEYQLEFLGLELKTGKITEVEHEKQVANVLNIPWHKVISLSMDPTTPSAGSIELDWNSKFVEDLKEHGYEGVTEEQVVDQWLSELCKNIAAQHFAGIGYFDEVMEIDAINPNAIQHPFIKSKAQTDNKREVK